MNIVTRYELKEMLDGQEYFLLINVLPEDEFYETHIPGSCNVPVSEPGFLKQVRDLVAERGKRCCIVIYSGGFHCSAWKSAANQLILEGYRNVSAYEGGMQDWLAADYPIVGEAAKVCDQRCAL